MMSSYQNRTVNPLDMNENALSNENAPSRRPLSRRSLLAVATVSVLGVLLLAYSSFPPSASLSLAHLVKSPHPQQKKSSISSTTLSATHDIPMPAGVNLGSWLSLEDYFYVGPTGAVEVATPDDNKAAVCLPPLFVGHENVTWQSETDLLSTLQTQVGGPQALRIFAAHRTSFVTEHDLATIASWGISHVRVPLSWCWTDADPTTIDPTRVSDEYAQKVQETFTCPDPFYPHVYWPAIPRSLLVDFLEKCAKYGITASLDVHTYPGATSPGTFSGLWPRPPIFWQHDTPPLDVGRQLWRDFVKWMESLADTHPRALQGLYGVSPMNEPAHLAGVFRTVPGRDYLPPLPRTEANVYLEQLNNQQQQDNDHKKHDKESFTTIPDGPHLRVMLWLQDAVQVFRDSSLPQLGKQLHVNVHESFLSAQVVKEVKKAHDPLDKDEKYDPATDLIGAWWSRVTTRHERSSWAVLDMHHYHAWDPECQGASDGPPMGNYTCSNVTARTQTLERCTSWAHTFRKSIDRQCGHGAQLMTGEFSTSTHHRVRHACNDIDTLQASYLMQMEAAQKAQVEMFYWSYKMPYGGAFRSAWSFSQLMYLLGVSNRPDVSNYNCGGHFSHDMEVTDDIFG